MIPIVAAAKKAIEPLIFAGIAVVNGVKFVVFKTKQGALLVAAAAVRGWEDAKEGARLIALKCKAGILWVHDELIKAGRVSRGWIDVSVVPLFSDLVDYMKQNGIPAPVDAGLLVSQSKKSGNADRAGIRGGTSQVRSRSTVFYVGGDIIVSVNGVKTDSVAQLYVALENTKPGDEAEVVYYHGSKKMTAKVQLSDRAKAGIAN